MINSLNRALEQRTQSSATNQSADSIYAGMTLSDLDRYRNELSPLETMYRDRIMGPQSAADRSKLLQTVAGNTDNAFGRAAARMNERRRASGMGGINSDDKRRLQINQQVTKAKNTTDAARYYDRVTEDLL